MRRVAPASGGSGELHEVPVVERALTNGDVYKGEFLAGAPHGKGKYVWADGCMYNGQWRRGKASGKGRFSWPSGATFEGDFRAGRIDGRGVFVGPDGATYRGAWAADRRHGHGAKSYANGDYYEGHWRRGLQDGHGRYVWSGGNHYVGDWRAGVISGRGVLVWTNGCRYEGLWENGVPKNPGTFTWPDGTSHLGSWPQNNLDFPDIPAGCKLSSSSLEKVPALPRICIWDSDGEAGDITCDIVDASSVVTTRTPQYSSRMQPEGRRPGETISKGHKNYELMLNLQLGIRHTVGKSAAKLMRELKPADFHPREKFWTRFPKEGSKQTPPHSSSEFRWKDYCPMVFRHLRKLFTVDPADYMLAICGDDALRELSSPGKSGSFFYLTQDNRFMIKTVKKSEVKLLIRMLPSYYRHVRQYNNSLITRFCGVHSVKPNGGQKVRFIVMGNLFCSEHQIHRRYDLKGSSYGRTAEKFEEIDEITTLKDLDLNFVFRLQRSWYKELHEQLRRDCQFLESEGIMDYSLLVGVHFRDDTLAMDMGSSTITTYPKLSTNMVSACQGGVSMRDPSFSAKDVDKIPDYRKSLVRLGVHLPAQAEHTSRSEIDSSLFDCGGLLIRNNKKGGAYDVILYFGIIDILQDYDITKKLEHAYKSLQTDPNLISSVDPKNYSQRFRDFICKIFIEDG